MISESSELQCCLCFEFILFYCLVYLLKVFFWGKTWRML